MLPENLTPNFVSDSGSKYYYTDKGVYRVSDHWGNVKTCNWAIDGTSPYISPKQVGYADFKSFKRI